VGRSRDYVKAEPETEPISEPAIAQSEPIESIEPITETAQESENAGLVEISYYSELDSCHFPKIFDGKRKCLTASGDIAGTGVVASNLYPFGTKLMIDGMEYIVLDRTAKRYSNRIDVFLGYGQEAHDQAIKNGIQYKEVQVIK